MINLIRNHFEHEILGVREKVIFILTHLEEIITFTIKPMNKNTKNNLKTFIFECIDFLAKIGSSVSVFFINNTFYIENGSKIILKN
ncbi:MAG: hypothetical protein ACOC3Z_00480 [Nanoarchaeota archaeon]